MLDTAPNTPAEDSLISQLQGDREPARHGISALVIALACNGHNLSDYDSLIEAAVYDVLDRHPRDSVPSFWCEPACRSHDELMRDEDDQVGRAAANGLNCLANRLAEVIGEVEMDHLAHLALRSAARAAGANCKIAA
jgi:hypothetical protein